MSLRTETIIYVVAVLVVVLYGIAGTYYLGQNGGFNVPITSLIEAAYFTIATVSTVGYGDIYPVTNEARLFVISLIIIGIGTFFTAAVNLGGEFVNTRVRNLTKRMSLLERRLLNKHIVLIGSGSTNQTLARTLRENGERYVLISSDSAVAEDLKYQGYRAYVSDYTSESSMRSFGIDKARAVIIDLRESSRTVYALLVALDLAKKAKIVVVSPTREAEKRMRHLAGGRATIINPAEIAAHSVAESLAKSNR